MAKKGKKNHRTVPANTAAKPVVVAGKPKTITLVMIVKNESKIITRLLNSCKRVIDNVCICDTGSTDDTIDKIEKWCKSNNVNYKVPVEEFVNFSYSRTFSYILGRHHFPDSDYFLLLDADMVLEVLPGFDKRTLTAHSYMIEQVSRTDKYWNVRLVRNHDKNKWKCMGVTHEYWSGTEKGYDQGELHTLRIDDREDGGSKADKFIRDERLFKVEFAKGVKDRGLEIRYLYYTGQTLQCLRKWEESIEYFRKRADVPIGQSYEEEGWYAMYRIGKSYLDWGKEIQRVIKDNTADELRKIEQNMRDEYEKEDEYVEYEDNFVGIPDDPDEMLNNRLSEFKGEPTIVKVKIYKPTPQIYNRENYEGKFAQAMYWFSLAYNRRPTRIEPLYEMICHYREKAQSFMAVMLCERALQIPFPKGDRLFVSYTFYDYLLDLEMAISAYYVPDKKRFGRQAAKRLLIKIAEGKVNNRKTAIHCCKTAKFYDDLHKEMKMALKALNITEEDLK